MGQMKRRIFRTAYALLFAILLAACGPADKIWPSDRIGPMWVNRYGHTNAEFIWDHCDGTWSEAPGTRMTECTVPEVDEMWIGHGPRGVDKAQRDALWEARTWELYIDGYEVDLPAFNIADFNAEAGGQLYEYRLWRIRLREIP